MRVEGGNEKKNCKSWPPKQRSRNVEVAAHVLEVGDHRLGLVHQPIQREAGFVRALQRGHQAPIRNQRTHSTPHIHRTDTAQTQHRHSTDQSQAPIRIQQTQHTAHSTQHTEQGTVTAQSQHSHITVTANPHQLTWALRAAWHAAVCGAAGSPGKRDKWANRPQVKSTSQVKTCVCVGGGEGRGGGERELGGDGGGMVNIKPKSRVHPS